MSTVGIAHKDWADVTVCLWLGTLGQLYYFSFQWEYESVWQKDLFFFCRMIYSFFICFQQTAYIISIKQ